VLALVELCIQIPQLLMTVLSVLCSSSSNSRRSSSRSASPSTARLPRGRGGSLSAQRSVLGRGRGRGRRPRLSLGSNDAASPEKRQPVVKRGGRKSVSSRLGTLAKKKGYLPRLIDMIRLLGIYLVMVFCFVFLFWRSN